jgi:hypothetical protein
MSLTARHRLACFCAFAASVVACNDTSAPAAPEIDGEWRFTESLAVAPPNACGGPGAFVFSGTSTTMFVGIVAPRAGGCPFKPYGTAILNGVVSGDMVSFNAGPCLHTGTLVGGRDSIAGTFTCSPPAPAGTGTWQAARTGTPTALALTPTAVTIPVGGSVRIFGTLTDAAGRELFGHILNWDMNPASLSIAGVTPDATGGLSALVTGLSPGVAVIIARGHAPDATGLDHLIGAGVTVTVTP